MHHSWLHSTCKIQCSQLSVQTPYFSRSHRLTRIGGALRSTSLGSAGIRYSTTLPLNMITPQPSPSMLISEIKQVRTARIALPASWMRCGTSKGLFIQRQDLPLSPNEWKSWLLAAMGSRGEDFKQLDGIGGASSTTSKVAVVSRSKVPGVDVEYTFAQVGVGKDVVDFTGNCGNIASGVGPFAVEQGLFEAPIGLKEVDIRILNTNTNSILVETVQLDGYGGYQELGNFSLGNITGSEVKVNFLNPAGTMTGKLFPTGRPSDSINLPSSSRNVRATLIDAGNPFVLVDAASLPLKQSPETWIEPDESTLNLLESIRRRAAVMMGLASDVKEASQTRGTPKIAVAFNPAECQALFPHNNQIGEADIAIISLSMGKKHPTLQLTGAVAVSSALSLSDTTPAKLSRTHQETNILRRRFKIAHSGGCIDIDVQSSRTLKGKVSIEGCSVSRNARILFDGKVRFVL